MKFPVIVLAGNYEEFRKWCEDHQLQESRDIVYMSNPFSCVGRHDIKEIVEIGTCEYRKDYEKLRTYAHFNLEISQ